MFCICFADCSPCFKPTRGRAPVTGRCCCCRRGAAHGSSSCRRWPAASLGQVRRGDELPTPSYRGKAEGSRWLGRSKGSGVVARCWAAPPRRSLHWGHRVQRVKGDARSSAMRAAEQGRSKRCCDASVIVGLVPLVGCQKRQLDWAYDVNIKATYKPVYIYYFYT